STEPARMRCPPSTWRSSKATSSPGTSASRRPDRAAETGERVARHPAEPPVGQDGCPVALVERDRRCVPVEHGPLEPRAAPLDGEARGVREERGPDAVSPVRGLDEEILEVETRRRPESRVVVEEEREADGRSARLRDERLGIPPRAEEMPAHGGGGAHDLRRQP